MKNIKAFLLLVLLALPLIYFTGCNKHDEITSPKMVDFNSPAFMIVDYTDVSNAIEDATLDSPMCMNNLMSTYGFLNIADGRPGANLADLMMNGGGRWMQLFDWGKDVGVFFGRLQLSDDQKSKIKDLVIAYHDAMKPLVAQFTASNKSIMDDANAKRLIILDSVKAGKITRLKAASDLKVLNEATRAAIENNSTTKAIKQQMCDLRSRLFNAIGLVLTPDQLIKWNTAIANLKNPCQ